MTPITLLPSVVTVMASIRKHPKSPFWFACFTLADGRRTTRSTGATDRRKAKGIANDYEEAERAAGEGRFIESRARKVIAEIYARANQQKLASSTAGDFLTAWLKRKELEAGDKTYARYSTVITQFKQHLGTKASRDVSSVTAADMTRFRDKLADRVTPGTVNIAVKILRAAFGQARRDGLVDVNEAERVTLLKRRDRFERRPFTLDELKRILQAANEEWRGMIMFGLYTGQRLSDIASLTWANLDLQRAEIRLVTGKTARRQILPLATPLVSYIEKLPAGDQADAPLFPNIYETVQRHQHAGNLSNAFYSILVSAGLAVKKTHKADPEKKGRSAKREQNELSFHSLRHTATSLLKAAGVSDAVAMEFIGHDSKSVSQHYTHIETATLKIAADKLPDITK